MKETLKRLRKYFVSGLLVFLPVGLTIYVFVWILAFTDNILGKYVEPNFVKTFGFYIPGIGIILLVYIIILIGFFVANYLGKRVYDFFDHLLHKIPFVKQVYPALKEMATFLLSEEKLDSFKQVVLVEYPRKGIYSIGFLTNEKTSSRLSEKVRHELANVFISTTPSPLTGFTILVPKNEIIMTDISIEEAFKFIVSGGVVNPS